MMPSADAAGRLPSAAPQARRRTHLRHLLFADAHPAVDAGHRAARLRVVHAVAIEEAAHLLATVMIGGLVTSTLFTLLALPTFYAFIHEWEGRLRRAPTPEPCS